MSVGARCRAGTMYSAQSQSNVFRPEGQRRELKGLNKTRPKRTAVEFAPRGPEQYLPRRGQNMTAQGRAQRHPG